MDGVFDALVGTAAADIARHRFTDLVARRFWILDQQRSCLHDLTGLAIAALRDVEAAPSLLNRMIARRMEPFDRRDLPADHVGNRGDTGAYGILVDKDGASAAESLAAAKLGARQSHLITQKPKQGKIGIAIPALFLAINLQLDHDRFSLFLS
jgi:hypothetical protein